MSDSVGIDFPKQQERVREVLKIYESIGTPGLFGAAMICIALGEAEQAMASGDIIAILRAYEKLKGIE